MTTLNPFDRQLLTAVLLQDGIAAVLSELAWLQIEADLTGAGRPNPHRQVRRALGATRFSFLSDREPSP